MRGSPSIHPRQPQSWTQQQHPIGRPNILHHDSMVQDLFASSGFDLETIPATDKGCVGELTTFSYSHLSQAALPFSSTAMLSNDPDAGAIYDVDEQSSWPSMHSAAPKLFTQPTASTPWGSISPLDSDFKSPTTPASMTSPILERVRGNRQAPTTASVQRKVRGSSPLASSMSYNESHTQTHPQAPPSLSSSPFFSQSSGYFVPPLEHSCPYSLTSTFFTSRWLSQWTFADNTATDPSLIQPYPAVQYPVSTFPLQPPHNFLQPSAPSPNPTKMSANGSARSASPYMRTHSWQPYPASIPSRRQSVSSVHSRHSVASGSSSDDSNKGLCPLPTCGRHVKDLKAHMLTHQNERPEKCPIPICEYHVKGFARKYDKNRHTLTHYKGTMVCGFCPGSGSAAEKSFNRADVFKRHLTSVHGVEQTPPNARRKTPGSGPGSSKRGASAGETPGICSTCSLTFASPQDFYEHLDDCVLRIVQQAEPSEAINEMLLASVTEDQDVQDTMERHNLPSGLDFSASTSLGGDEDEAVEDEEGDDEDNNDGTYGDRTGKSGKGSIRSRKSGSSSGSSYPRGALGDHISSNGGIGKLPASRKSGGLTYSKNGVPLATAGKAPKRRKNYPLSWGAAPDKMKMRKRVLCVFDGPRRLWKDDMMLDADHEVRVPLPQEMGDGRQWVTDLDVETLRRAEGVLGATEEEKGPWVVDDDEDDGELERLMQ